MVPFDYLLVQLPCSLAERSLYCIRIGLSTRHIAVFATMSSVRVVKRVLASLPDNIEPLSNWHDTLKERMSNVT